MTNARAVRPTDLVALVSFDGRVYPNEAHTWDRLGRQPEGPNLLENALEHWFQFATGRHTWISIQGQTIRGVVSARSRGSRLAWEIDCLIGAGEDEETVLLSLLAQLTGGAISARVLRVFLRVSADSALVEAGRKSGFMPLATEWLLRLGGDIATHAVDADVQIRDRTRSDGFALFRLYNQVTPPEVRRLEAATYAEWIAAQEKRSQARGRLDVVVECGAEIVAWVRAVPDERIGRLDLLVAPGAARQIPVLVGQAVRFLGSRRPVFCLVPAYAGALAAALEQAGFVHSSDYISLVKRLALPVGELRPIRVATHQPLATM